MDNVGLKKGELIIMDYTEDYKRIYDAEKEELLKIYNGRINSIEHVGSTSIKNIKSKPIIDILIQTDDLDDFKEMGLTRYRLDFFDESYEDVKKLLKKIKNVLQ